MEPGAHLTKQQQQQQKIQGRVRTNEWSTDHYSMIFAPPFLQLGPLSLPYYRPLRDQEVDVHLPSISWVSAKW